MEFSPYEKSLKGTVTLADFGEIRISNAAGSADTITATATVSEVSVSEHSLVVELLDETGNPADYPAGTMVTIAGEDVKVHDNRAILKDVTAGSYAIAVKNLPGGSYRLKVSLAQETEPMHPMQEIVASVTTQTVTLTPVKTAMKAVQTGSRVLPAGGGSLYFEAQLQGTQTFSWILQEKVNGSYQDVGTATETIDTTLTVQIPANETGTAKTYRVLFYCGSKEKPTASFPYAIIVEGTK